MSQLLSQSQTQLKSQPPACIQCGGTEYILESGYYFCADCQVQSQDIREEVFNEYAGGLRGTKVATVKSQETVQAEVSFAADKPELTSWEALNIILSGFVNELTLLGAPKELKIVALQLWARYLMKTEAAFLSKNIEKRPRLGLNFRTRDAELIYGTDPEIIRIQKRPVFRPHKRNRYPSKSDSDLSKHSRHATKRMEKYRLTMKKKKLATAEYAASTTSASSRQSELTLENLSTRSPSILSEKSQKSCKFQYSKTARKSLIDLLDNAAMVDEVDRDFMQKRCIKKNSRDVDHATILKLIAILRISLLILDSNIHLGDILRWIDEGYLSVLNAEKLIPSGFVLHKDVKSIFITVLSSRNTINTCVMKMVNALQIPQLKARILPLIQRYIQELHLPDEIYSVTRNFIALKPPHFKLSASANYEGLALAYIIFTLKFLFSLDGVTEKEISKFAAHINSQEKGSKRLFDWSEWVRYINCRNSFISAHHHISRDYYYPTSNFGGLRPFLSHWEKVPAKQTVNREHSIDTSLAECIMRSIKGFCQEPDEPLSPSLEPMSSILKTLLRRNQNIPSRTKSILMQNFTSDTINYLTSTNRQKELCKKYNIERISTLAAQCVKVKPVSLHSSTPMPSVKGKQKVDIKIIDEDMDLINLRKEFSMLSTKKSTLPDSEVVQQGVFLKYISFKDKNILPQLGRGYWVYHSSFSNVRTQMATFDHLAESIFSPDFLWLLKEAAHIGHLSPRDLYHHLSEVEKMYLQFIPHGKKGKGSLKHW